MAEKKKVYVEASVVSNLTSRLSKNVQDLARQLSTRDWWESRRIDFDLYYSAVVEREISRGDADAAAKRREALVGLTKLAVTPQMESLAEVLLEKTAVPRNSFDDAMHIAVATVNKMDYLLTWNCTHIANAATMPIIYRVCKEVGYECPVLCTPDQLMT